MTAPGYAGQRFYSSMYGRLNARDPSGSTATAPSDSSVPQSWNRYAYAGSDPINSNDPTGLDTCVFDDDGQLVNDQPPENRPKPGMIRSDLGKREVSWSGFGE
jgi:RHS repeat-associated protein